MHVEIIQWVLASQSNVMKTSLLIKHILTVPSLPFTVSGIEDLASN